MPEINVKGLISHFMRFVPIEYWRTDDIIAVRDYQDKEAAGRLLLVATAWKEERECSR